MVHIHAFQHPDGAVWPHAEAVEVAAAFLPLREGGSHIARQLLEAGAVQIAGAQDVPVGHVSLGLAVFVHIAFFLVGHIAHKVHLRPVGAGLAHPLETFVHLIIGGFIDDGVALGLAIVLAAPGQQPEGHDEEKVGYYQQIKG